MSCDRFLDEVKMRSPPPGSDAGVSVPAKGKFIERVINSSDSHKSLVGSRDTVSVW